MDTNNVNSSSRVGPDVVCVNLRSAVVKLCYLCALASLADVAKGGDGAKSALPDLYSRLFVSIRSYETIFD